MSEPSFPPYPQFSLFPPDPPFPPTPPGCPQFPGFGPRPRRIVVIMLVVVWVYATILAMSGVDPAVIPLLISIALAVVATLATRPRRGRRLA